MEARIDPPATSSAGLDAIHVERVSKSFPGVQALKGVDFVLREGEVHGLVGENGAGKSTLIKILTGAYTADKGSIEIFGEAVDQHGPRAQQRAGVAAIYQELTVVADMSAASNVFLGRPMRRGPMVNRRAMEQRFRELGKRLGVTIQPRALAGDLSVANQQMLEIMRALKADHRILIMDEPTASLGPNERERLYETVGRLRDERTSVIYISHDLDEVLRLCDRISVMRDGEMVATADVGAWDKEKLVSTMLGTELRALPARRRASDGDELLRVEGVSVPGKLQDISFVLRTGEIFGIAGLVGAGRTELLCALAGTQPGATGTLTIDGPHAALAAHDRPGTGARDRACARRSKGPRAGAEPERFRERHHDRHAQNCAWRDRTKRAPQIGGRGDRDLARLRSAPSGRADGDALGRQSAEARGRQMASPPAAGALDGRAHARIDVGAKGEMFAVMRRLADEGMAIIMVSSELEEVVEIADRVLVLAKGRQVAILEREDLSLERVLTMTFGVEGEAAA